MNNDMSKRDWIIAGTITFLIGIVFMVAMIKGQANKEIYEDFSSVCLKENGVVVNNKNTMGYECYQNQILIDYYDTYTHE